MISTSRDTAVALECSFASRGLTSAVRVGLLIVPMAKVLVVDDQADYCRPLVRLFQLAGHEARSVQDGEEALKYLGVADAPDVVLLDIMMPEMDGLEVLRQVRRDPRLSAVPIVMFTAVCDPVLERHALEKGAN